MQTAIYNIHWIRRICVRIHQSNFILQFWYAFGTVLIICEKKLQKWRYFMNNLGIFVIISFHFCLLMT